MRGEFDVDVEDDPPAKPLHAEEIDYLRTSFSAKVKTYVAYLKAKKYRKRLL